jgi:hypothetical protein
VVYSGNVAELDRERVVTELGIGRLLGGLHTKPGLRAKPPLPPGPPTTGRRAAPGRSIKRGKI